jgi:O-antigen/teichoic acid export membrane protein
MPAFSTCTICGFNAEGAVDTCPRCGAPTTIKQEPRTRGIILVICGLVLIGLMGTVTIALLPTLLHAGKDVGGSDFEGTTQQAQMILGLFAVIIAFGFTSLAYGIYQLVYRRESKAFIVVTLLLVAVLLVAVWLTMSSLKATP